MSFFKKILEKVGLKKDKTAGAAASTATPTTPAAAKPAAASPARLAKDDAVGTSAPKEAAPAPISEVDVVANLERMAAANPAKLNWKVSIVDLLKLLDLDSSFEARKELATELECPADLMNDSAKMNTWLHKEVLKRIAANGGNIPKELLEA
jgi:hypothetical protein